MTLRALLQYSDRLKVRNLTAAALSMTGTPVTGFEYTNLLDDRLNKYMLVPSGGPHTLQFDFGANKERFDVISLLCPPNTTLTGSPLVRLRDTPTGSDIFTSNVSVRPPIGMPDRRHFVLPTQTVARYLQVILDSGNRLGYVRYGWAMDLSRFAEPLLGWGVNDPSVVQEQPLGGIFYPTTNVGASNRWLSYEQRFRNVPATTLHRDAVEGTTSGLSAVHGAIVGMYQRVGKADPILWLPYAESDTTKTTNLDLMACTGLYGRITNDLELTYQGTGSWIDDEGASGNDGELRSFSLKLEGFI